MYTLKKVLELVNAGSDIYCELYRSADRSITEGWLSDLDLDFNQRVESYALENDGENEYLVLHIA